MRHLQQGAKFFRPGTPLSGQNERSTPVVMQNADEHISVVWPTNIRTQDPVFPLPKSSVYFGVGFDFIRLSAVATAPLPLAGEVGSHRRCNPGGGSLHLGSVTRGGTPTPALPRKSGRGSAVPMRLDFNPHNTTRRPSSAAQYPA